MRPIFVLPVLLLIAIVLQLTGAIDKEDSRSNSLRVPFFLERNRVIIPTGINGSRKYNVILDTGMRFDGVYLFHKEFVDEIDMTGAIDVQVGGAGSGEATTNKMIESGRLNFGDLTVDSQMVIISQSPHTQGFPTDGVIGWNLFGHYAVEIDYDSSVIYLHDIATFQPGEGWTEIPVEMKKDLPFLQAELQVVEGETVSMVF